MRARSPLAGLLLCVSGRRRRFRVAGRSMEPALRDGQTVLVDPRAYRCRGPAPGDVVLVRHPYRPADALIKRVAQIAADGRLLVAGDNAAESTDSRTFGALAPGAVLGRVDGFLV